MCFFFKQKTAYEMRISDWSSDVCSSDLTRPTPPGSGQGTGIPLVSDCGSPRRKRESSLCPLGSNAHLVTFQHECAARQNDARARGRSLDEFHHATSSETRRVGKEWVSTFRSRCAHYN